MARMSVKEAARLLGRTDRTIHNYIASGKLKPVYTSETGKHVLDSDDIRAFAEKYGITLAEQLPPPPKYSAPEEVSDDVVLRAIKAIENMTAAHQRGLEILNALLQSRIKR